jgi:glycosyltransferase involved in cell wall biosynthesis
LALLIKKRNNCKNVVYDGRGAIETEWKEYKVVTDKELTARIFDIEKEVVLKSDYRIAVSNALVNFWKSEFEYSNNHHVVIPCTLNSDFENIEIDYKKISLIRKELSFNSDDKVFVYSGSVAGWQSFNLLDNFLSPLLINNLNFKVLFLSHLNDCIRELIKKFPNQIICKHLSPNQVGQYLVACDYGLLLREETITNKVASPVKFAEYLSCGLKIIISNNLGDYSEFVKNSNCGFNTNVSESEKKRIRELALSNFRKINFMESYKSVLKLK